MSTLKTGDVANKDENRMTRHYWLRNSKIVPFAEIQWDIDSTIENIKIYEKVHSGDISGQDGKFENVLFLGIGGSALGPQLIYDSLVKDSKINCCLIDNANPNSIDLIPGKLVRKHGKTLFCVTSNLGALPNLVMQ
jgi:glucose-6-phosphate isomerase